MLLCCVLARVYHDQPDFCILLKGNASGHCMQKHRGQCLPMLYAQPWFSSSHGRTYDSHVRLEENRDQKTWTRKQGPENRDNHAVLQPGQAFDMFPKRLILISMYSTCCLHEDRPRCCAHAPPDDLGSIPLVTIPKSVTKRSLPICTYTSQKAHVAINTGNLLPVLTRARQF